MALDSSHVHKGRTAINSKYSNRDLLTLAAWSKEKKSVVTENNSSYNILTKLVTVNKKPWHSQILVVLLEQLQQSGKLSCNQGDIWSHHIQNSQPG